MQTTLQNKINAIDAAAEAAAQKKIDAENARIAASTKANEEAERLKAEAVKKYAEVVKKEREKVKEATLNSIDAILEGEKLSALASAKTEKEREQIEAKFAAKKRKMAIADILLQQGQAMAAAIAGAQAAAAATGPGAVVASPLFTAQMLAIVLGGFAQIKGIMNQAGAANIPDLQEPSLGGGGGGGQDAGGGATLALTPDLAQSFNAALGSSAVQAYVVQNDIADANALQQELQTQAELG